MAFGLLQLLISVTQMFLVVAQASKCASAYRVA